MNGACLPSNRQSNVLLKLSLFQWLFPRDFVVLCCVIKTVKGPMKLHLSECCITYSHQQSLSLASNTCIGRRNHYRLNLLFHASSTCILYVRTCRGCS